MAIPQSAMIIEPHATMRESLHDKLTQCGVENVEHAVSSSVAIKSLRKKTVDVILCEYDLGEGQDGQQLLEDLRHNNVIPLSTMFFMITAERSYEKVVSAAELAPTDYILKPFAADVLYERFTRATERRGIFLPIYRLIETGFLQEAIDACLFGETAHKRYMADFLRLRAELFITLGKPEEAEKLYIQLNAIKAVAWAKLGLGKALYMQEKFTEAEEILENLVQENNKFMDAYDWLAKTHEAIGQLPKAKEVLAQAVNVSPHAVRRLRKLGQVALETGDAEVAEKSFQKVVSKAKYSEFRDPEDHVHLVASLTKNGNVEQAATVIRDLERSFKDTKKMPACRALSAALVHTQEGDKEKASRELANAVAESRDTMELSENLKLELAKNCLENNLEEAASEVILSVMNNSGNKATLSKAMKVFEDNGKKDLAEKLVNESKEQIATLVSSGVEKAKSGDYQGAVSAMTEAVIKLPNNPQVVFNAALAVLKYLENQGWDSQLADQAKNYIETTRRIDPGNTKLTALTNYFQNIQKKYGVKKFG